MELFIMVFKTKTLLICSLFCALGIVESRCFAMQYRTAAQEAKRQKRYLLDQFNVHKELKDKEDIKWLTTYKQTILTLKFATEAELNALISGQEASSTADPKPVQKQPANNTIAPVKLANDAVKKQKKAEKQAEQPKIVTQPKPAEQQPTVQPQMAPQPAVPATEETEQKLRSQMQEIVAARAARYAAQKKAQNEQLLKELPEREKNGDLQWLQDNRQQLIEIDPALQEDLDEIIGALTLSLSSPSSSSQQSGSSSSEDESDTADSAAQNSSTASSTVPVLDPAEERLLLAEYHKMAKGEIQDASTEQAAARIIVRLYKTITANYADNYKKYYEVLEQLLPELSLAQLHAQLAALEKIAEVNAIVGDEIAMLRGHMLYRIWEIPQNINSNIALKAFAHALKNNDINAAINIFRDFLSKLPLKNHIVQQLVMPKFKKDVNGHNADAIYDLYHHFIQDSNKKDEALLQLCGCIKDGTMPADKWGIIALCFVHSAYADEILPMIAKQLRAHVPMYIEDLPCLVVLYDNYRTAVINGETEQALELAKKLVGRVIDREAYDTVIASIRRAGDNDMTDFDDVV